MTSLSTPVTSADEHAQPRRADACRVEVLEVFDPEFVSHKGPVPSARGNVWARCQRFVCSRPAASRSPGEIVIVPAAPCCPRRLSHMLRRSFIPLLAALAMTILSVSAMPAHGTGSTLKTYSQTYQVAAQGAVTVICPQIETGPDNWTS